MSLGIGSMVRWSFVDGGEVRQFKGRVVAVLPAGILSIQIGEEVVLKPAGEVVGARGRPPKGA